MRADICMGCFEPMNGFEVCSHCGWYSGAVPEHAYHLHQGTVLQGRYIIGNSVGVGGFGITYRAWDTTLNSLVAIKEFYPAGLVSRVPGEKNIVIFTGDKKEQFDISIARFLEEAKNMAKFNGHPNIVNVYDFFNENNTAYIVMEFLDGVDVKAYLKEMPDGRVDIDTALSIVNPLLDALMEIHSKGIIHRDISPDNIMITADNKIKIFDLGAARLTKGDKEETRSVVVKTGYTPPEQYREKSKQGAYTDIYSAGAVFYRLITGNVPDESIDRMVKDELPKPSKLGIEIDINIERAIMKALALKSELRFQNAAAFKDAIANKKMVDFPEDELRKRRKIRIAFASAITAFTLAFFAVFMFYMQDFVTGKDYLVAENDTISVFLPVSDDEETGMRQAEMYQKIVDGFVKNAAEGSGSGEGNQFEVEFATAPISEYHDALMARINDGDAPTVFNTDFFDDDLTEYTASLDLLLSSVSSDECIILDEYEKAYPNKCEMPTGFYSNVVYVNQAAAREAGIEIPNEISNPTKLFETAKLSGDGSIYTVGMADDNIDDILSAMVEGGLYSFRNKRINSEAEEAFAVIGDAIDNQQLDYAASNPLDSFLANKMVYYIDDTNELTNFRTYLPGYYSVLPLTNNGKLVVCMTKHVGVYKDADENKQKVAMQLIRFMLSEFSQDLIHIQNKTALPLNKNSLEAYLSYNGDIDFIEDYIGSFKVVGEERHKCYSFNVKLYDDIIMKHKDYSTIKEYMDI